MKTIFYTVTRILLGTFMVIFGLNKFLEFVEIPRPLGDGGQLMEIYISSGFIYLIGLLELAGGIALLIKKWVPLALTFITAIMFNAFVFHALHDPWGMGGAAVCLLLCIIQVLHNKNAFSALVDD